MIFCILSFFTFFSTLLLTAGIRRYALSRQVLDIPNARSSHSIPTPRGGGLGIVISFYLATLAMRIPTGLAEEASLAVLGAGSLVVGIGWLDDNGHVRVSLRFGVHVLAAGLAIFLIGRLPVLPIGPWAVDLGIVGYPAGILFVVWMLNLYNFMDGIDGIAGIEAVTVAWPAAFLLWLHGASELAGCLVLLGAGSAGFLVWNWPPARIFMGDGGSGYLGFAFAVLALISAGRGLVSLWTWLILLGVFVVDASITLLRRVVSGQKWHEAHRSHAYQYAARRYDSHRTVTMAVAVINTGWLFPLAWLASAFPAWGALCLVVAWTPLVILALQFQAGMPENQNSLILTARV